MRTTIIIFLFIAIKIYGQKSDTLYIEKYKFPLLKTKIYYNSRQKGFPSLPSEYTKTERKDFILKFKCINSDEYEISTDNDGNQFTVLIGSAIMRDSCSKCEDGYFTYNNIVDTLTLSNLYFNSTTPYLKIDKKNYFLTSARLQRLSNDTLTKCSFDAPNDRLSVDFSFTSSNFINSKMRFILSDIYYKKNNTTYYLDKAFFIKINNR